MLKFKPRTIVLIVSLLLPVFGYAGSQQEKETLRAMDEAYEKQYLETKKLGLGASAADKERVTAESFQHANEQMGKLMSARQKTYQRGVVGLAKKSATNLNSIYKNEKDGKAGKAYLKKGAKKSDNKDTAKIGAEKPVPQKSPAPVGRLTDGPAEQGGVGSAESVDFSQDIDGLKKAAAAKAAPKKPEPKKK